jgi:hypothetical protein
MRVQVCCGPAILIWGNSLLFIQTEVESLEDLITTFVLALRQEEAEY